MKNNSQPSRLDYAFAALVVWLFGTYATIRGWFHNFLNNH